jgi:hypothetical protein
VGDLRKQWQAQRIRIEEWWPKLEGICISDAAIDWNEQTANHETDSDG